MENRGKETHVIDRVGEKRHKIQNGRKEGRRIEEKDKR
jgi:hypothetical protein